MKKIMFIFYTLFFLASNTNAQQLIVEGRNHGKKLYILNPKSAGDCFCVEKIEINNKLTSFKNASAFEINLDSLGFNLGESIKIIIYHKSDCKPKLLVDNSKARSSSEISSLTLDKSGILKWTAKEKSNKNNFIIQQFINYQWVKIGEVESKANKKVNEYSYTITTELKDSKFRIMQTNEFGSNKVTKVVSVSN